MGLERRLSEHAMLAEFAPSGAILRLYDVYIYNTGAGTKHHKEAGIDSNYQRHCGAHLTMG